MCENTSTNDSSFKSIRKSTRARKINRLYQDDILEIPKCEAQDEANNDVLQIDMSLRDALLQALGLQDIPAELLNSKQQHLIIANQMSLQCTYCQSIFNTKACLERHCIEEHKVSLIYYCKICAKLCRTRHQLSKHKSVAHPDQKPYACSECTLSFKSIEALIAHVRKHNGKLPYYCHICGTGYDLQRDFKSHMNVHKMRKIVTLTNSKSYQCEICKQIFGKPCDLERHIRVHTGEKPFICSVCGNRFQQADNLKKHMVTHTREKQFECDLCKRLFGRRDVLRRHMTTHSIHKPHQCSVCFTSFGRRAQLEHHKKKHH